MRVWSCVGAVLSCVGSCVGSCVRRVFVCSGVWSVCGRRWGVAMQQRRRHTRYYRLTGLLLSARLFARVLICLLYPPAHALAMPPPTPPVHTHTHTHKHTHTHTHTHSTLPFFADAVRRSPRCGWSSSRWANPRRPARTRGRRSRKVEGGPSFALPVVRLQSRHVPGYWLSSKTDSGGAARRPPQRRRAENGYSAILLAPIKKATA
jgi:hypothetical protein